MSIITKVLKQKAVYWSAVGSNNCNDEPAYDEYGKKKLQSPIELNARWEDTREEVIRADGTSVVSRSKVMVSEDVVVGGYLMFGTLDDVEDLSVPLNNSLVYEIIQFDVIPNFKATENLRVAYL